MSIGLSPAGILGLFLFGLLAAAVLFIEFGVIILISEKAYFEKSVSIMVAFIFVVRKLPKLLSFGIFQMFFIMIVLLPFYMLVILTPLLDVNIIILINDIRNYSWAAKYLYFLLVVFVLYVSIRWIFVFHYIFIENHSIYKAIRLSWQLTKNQKWSIATPLILLNGFFITILYFMTKGILYIRMLLKFNIFESFISEYLLTISSFLVLVLTLILIPLHMIILTRIYHLLHIKKDEPRLDKLEIPHGPRFKNFEQSIARFYKRKRSMLIVCGVVLLSGIVLLNHLIEHRIVQMKCDVQIAGHRGDGSYGPENSMSSIISAIDKGVDAVEIDVVLTKDDVVVLSHDEDLLRLAGLDLNIADTTYERLSKINIGKSFDFKFNGERIPKLSQVLEYAKRANIKVIIDVKVDEKEKIYAEEIMNLISFYEAEDLVLVQAFNTLFLEEVRKIHDTIEIGQVLFVSAGTLSKLDVDFYTIHESMLTDRFMQQAKKDNRDVWVWTVNEKRNMKEVLKYDVDGIITDSLDKAQDIIKIE